MKRFIAIFSLLIVAVLTLFFVPSKEVGAVVYEPTSITYPQYNSYCFFTITYDTTFGCLDTTNHLYFCNYFYLCLEHYSSDYTEVIRLVPYTIDGQDTEQNDRRYRNLYFDTYLYESSFFSNDRFYIIAVDRPIFDDNFMSQYSFPDGYIENFNLGATGIRYITKRYNFNLLNSNRYIYINSNDDVQFYYYSSTLSYAYNFNIIFEVNVPSKNSDWFVSYYNGNIWGSSSYSNAYQNGKIDGFEEGKQKGYDLGLLDNQTNIRNEAYNDGYDIGKLDGIDIGYQSGLADGLADSNSWFGVGLLSLVDIPFIIFKQIFNFDIFGFNIYAIVLSLLTIGIILWLLRKLFFNKG